MYQGQYRRVKMNGRLRGWSDTEYVAPVAWSRDLHYANEYLTCGVTDEGYGYSVRLVKDIGTYISTYNLEITDSVMVNFIRNTSADFSACNAIINNSTFNNNLTQISANFS